MAQLRDKARQDVEALNISARKDALIHFEKLLEEDRKAEDEVVANLNIDDIELWESSKRVYVVPTNKEKDDSLANKSNYFKKLQFVRAYGDKYRVAEILQWKAWFDSKAGDDGVIDTHEFANMSNEDVAALVSFIYEQKQQSKKIKTPIRTSPNTQRANRKKQFSNTILSFQRIDKNGDGKCVFRELLSAIYPYASRRHLDWMESLAYARVRDVNEVKKHKLSKNQVREIKCLFRAYDKDNSGSLDYDEVEDGLNSLGYDTKEIIHFFTSADTDNDGNLSLEEFLALMENHYYN